MKKHVAIIALVLQNLRLLCLSFLTISKASFSINNERFRIEEIYAESKEINQDYFRFQGKRSALVQSLPNPIPGERIQARDGTYSFTILTDGLKEDTILSEGRYPENDNEIMVSRIFESTIKLSKEEKWLGYELKQKQLLGDTVLKVVGILDTKVNVLSKDNRRSPFLISKIDTSFLCTENRFNAIIDSSSHYISWSYYISKIESLKQFKSILRNPDIECTYQSNKTSGLDAGAVSTTELILYFLIVPFFLAYRILSIHFQITYSVKASIISSVILFLTGFLSTLIADIIWKSATRTAPFYFHLGYTALIYVPFVIFGLLVNLAPHIKRFIHEKKTDKLYRSIGL